MISQEKILAADLNELINLAMETFKSEENQKLINSKRPVKFKTGIGRTIFSKTFKFSTLDYFNDPAACLKAQLRWKLWTFHSLQDDTPFDLKVGIDYATAYEPSFFGVDYFIEEGKEPTYSHPIITDMEDLKKVAIPDFFKSGLMPKAHEMYAALKDLSKDRLQVFFPGFARGPWSVATILRGFNDLFLDSVDEPEFVHELMQFAVDARISWEKQRCDFLGIDPKDQTYRWKYVAYRNNANSDLFEDEVDGNLFSPEMNREFVIPYQKQLSDFYGGINYYHSCGNMTSFLEDIQTLNLQTMQHISAWTDFEKAAKIMPSNITLQYSLHATADVVDATPEQMRSKIRYLIDHANGRNVDICADALYEGEWEVLEKLKLLCRIFREESNQSRV